MCTLLQTLDVCFHQIFSGSEISSENVIVWNRRPLTDMIGQLYSMTVSVCLWVEAHMLLRRLISRKPLKRKSSLTLLQIDNNFKTITMCMVVSLLK